MNFLVEFLDILPLKTFLKDKQLIIFMLSLNIPVVLFFSLKEMSFNWIYKILGIAVIYFLTLSSLSNNILYKGEAYLIDFNNEVVVPIESSSSYLENKKINKKLNFKKLTDFCNKNKKLKQCVLRANSKS